MTQVRIIIFAKVPHPGTVKTRLIPVLGVHGAARLAAVMLAHTVQKACDADVGPVELCMSPSPDDDQWARIQLPEAIVRNGQGEGDLGARMERAAKRALMQDDAVILIGTDCPDLGVAHLIGAAELLGSYDSVIHPTMDGGYALLGLRCSVPALFSEIPWGSEEVARITLNRLDALGWSTAIGPILHDVDEPRDLAWVPASWRPYTSPPGCDISENL